MTVYFRVIVNELGGEFDLVIDPDREVIMIEEFQTVSSNKSANVYTFTGQPQYMYALRAVQDGSNHRNERWLPVMGSEIDISKLIPRSGEYRLAVRLVDAEMDDDGFYSEDDRQMRPLGTRQTLSTADRRSVSYNNGMIKIAGGTQDVLYRVGGISQWSTATLTTDEENTDGIIVSPALFPLGGTIEIRFKPAEDSNARFASPAFRIKIPKAGRAPRIRDNERRQILTGFTARMEWSAGPNEISDGEDGDGWEWNTCPRGAVPYSQLAAVFEGLQSEGTGSNRFFNLYIRTAATAKMPPSAPVIFKIPANRYSE
ncbi:MAG: hypothetical protein FWD23_16825, partial [Oscillospiraceae bacterium]|nr:hypothetical protein [Oscillospiraceae bacterium]